jgi:flavodoxin
MKTIVIYYSVSGQTKFTAKKIAEYLNCDILQIQTDPVINPSLLTRYFQGGKSMITGTLPKLRPYEFHIENYDNILLGCPTWGGDCPPAVKAFIRQNCFSNKNMYLFTTYVAANASKCLKNLTNYFNNSTIKNTATFSIPSKKDVSTMKNKLTCFCGMLKQ